jgi:hypothetical protein
MHKIKQKKVMKLNFNLLIDSGGTKLHQRLAPRLNCASSGAPMEVAHD